MARKASSPPWEVLLLVSQHLDPKALAVASCVSKSWFLSMTSAHLWEPLCLSHYPALSSLHRLDPTIPYHRLFSMASASCSRLHGCPPEPRIKLHQISFAIDVETDHSPVLSLVKPGEGLEVGPHEIFRFDFDVADGEAVEGLLGLRVGWSVVGKGWTGLFSMVGGKAKGASTGPRERWFSEELPSSMLGPASGMVAEVGLGFCAGDDERGAGGKIMRLEKMRLGLLSVVNWRYVSVDEGLNYLQHFLLPSY